MKPGSHGSTFGSNPLGMAVASTVLSIKQAPIGKPPPIPFAIGTISGPIFAHSNANNFPVLPNPH